MTRRRILATALASITVAACHDRIGPGWDWNRMRIQPKALAYGESSAFADSMAMRRPPDGTVPHDSTIAPDTPPDSARGADRFHIYCAVCHGDRGDGHSVVASNMEPPKPPSLLTDSIRNLTADRLDQVMIHGYGRMPALGTALSATDRQAIRAYIATLQRAATSGP
jgi:mono/diheme cytochrome c family protein